MNNMTKRILAVAISGALCGAVLLTQGCDKPDEGKSKDGGENTPVAAGSVGVVDVIKVADALGWTDKMKAGIAAEQAQLKANVQTLQADVQKSLTDEIKNEGLKPEDLADPVKVAALSTAQKQKIGQWQAQLNNLQQQLNQALQQIQQQYAAEWDKQYSRALLPEIRKVAGAKHLAAVFNSQQVIWKDGGNDISDAVVDAANSDKVKPEDVPLPPPIGVNLKTLFATPSATTAPSSTTRP